MGELRLTPALFPSMLSCSRFIKPSAEFFDSAELLPIPMKLLDITAAYRRRLFFVVEGGLFDVVDCWVCCFDVWWVFVYVCVIYVGYDRLIEHTRANRFFVSNQYYSSFFVNKNNKRIGTWFLQIHLPLKANERKTRSFFLVLFAVCYIFFVRSIHTTTKKVSMRFAQFHLVAHNSKQIRWDFFFFNVLSPFVLNIVN